MSAAAGELLSLGPVGLQLTPGCVPTRHFAVRLAEHEVTTRTHHGFCFDATRRPVWQGSELLTPADSVHPPHTRKVQPETFLAELASGTYRGTAMETMYPGHCLGSGDEIDAAMDLEASLAVDVSHVHMQLHQRVMSAATWSRLQNYAHVDEVHLSSNDGTRDQHRAIDDQTFGIDWALDHAAAGTPVILENYMQRQPVEDRVGTVSWILTEIERRQR